MEGCSAMLNCWTIGPLHGQKLISPDYETSVDLWPDIIAMELPFPHIPRLYYSSFKSYNIIFFYLCYRFVQEWVFQGTCRDIYDEFMIQVNEDFLRFRGKANILCYMKMP